MDRIYITLSGKSTYAIVNSFWATLKIHGYVPDKIYILYDEFIEENLSTINDSFRCILAGYGLDLEIVPIEVNVYDFVGCTNAIKNIFRLNRKSEFSLDITSGRKYMVSAAILAGWKKSKHVFFLQTEEYRYGEASFMMRPLMYQYPADLKQETEGKL